MSGVFWVSSFGIVLLAMTLLGGWSWGTAVMGVVSFFVMIYVVMSSLRANAAQARMDGSNVGNAHGLIRQCQKTLDKADRASRDLDSEQMHRMLGQLYERVSLFWTQYGKYVQPETADIVWEVENSIIAAKGLQERELRPLIALLYSRLDAIRSRILDSDDPMLRDLRSRV